MFSAPLVAPDGDEAVQFETLNSSDIIDGGEGVDRLNATLGDENDNPAPLISNVEQFFFRSVDGNSNPSMEFVSGAEQIWNDRSTGELNIDNVQNGVVIGLNDVRAATKVDYAGGVLGADFTQTVVARGAGTATTVAQLDIDTDGGDDITGLNLIADTGVNNINLTSQAAGIADLTITGAAELMLKASGNFGSIENVDATAYEGDLELDISGQQVGENLNVALGAGADSLTVSEAVLIGDNENTDPSDDTAALDGGEGEDNLTVALASPRSDVGNLNFENVMGFEQLTLARAGVLELPMGELEIDLRETDFTALVVNAPLDIAGKLTVKGSEDFTTIDLEGVLSGDGSVALEGFDTVEINANANVTTDITAAELTSATLNLGDSVVANVGSLTADLLETLTVNLGENGELTGPTAGSAAALTTITVTGGANSSADYTFGGEEESLTTIDLSGMAGDVTGDATVAPALGDNGLAFVDDVGNDLSIVIGEGDLDYLSGDADEDDQEVFSFVGDDIGLIDISGFTSGVGGNGDRLDFSGFADVSGLGDLEIIFDEGGSGKTVITSDGFDGEITVQGVDLSTDAFNFIF